MDGAQIDARPVHVQIGQRREIAVGGGIEHRDMDPIDAPPGMGGKGVGHDDGAAQIIGLPPGPAAEGAVAKMIAKLGVLRD